MRPETRGMLLGVLGVAIFAATLPMTRMATGTTEAAALSPWFVTFGRAVLAAALSALFLVATRSKLPAREHWPALAVSALGNALGFPLFLALAMRSVTASHAAVMTALLPLATAVFAALVMRSRARPGFWLCAVAGSVLVIGYALLRAHQAGQGFALSVADWLLVASVASASLGYVYGARATAALGAERVICWVCICALPITLPGMLLSLPQAPVPPQAWAGFAYVGVFSMWAGFFAWFRGLALGGALRVSQTQLLQPFFAILFAVPLLGEPLDAVSLIFAAGVVGTVLLGRRLSRG